MSTPSLQYGKDGTVESPLSAYQEPREVSELTSVADIDLQTGDEILSRPFEEFNGMSLIQRANLDQKDWLAWSEAPSEDPDESWMFTGTSNATRNAIISTAAHLTQEVAYPKSFAQNDEDEEDVAAAHVMDAALEYNCRRDNYQQTFLYGVITGLVNPVSYFKVEYSQQLQEVTVGTSSNFKKEEVIDDVYSGFQYSLLPLDEVLIGNPYVFEMQKQPFVIHRRRIPYNEAKSMFGSHPNWEHVQPGVYRRLNSADGLFYDVDDTPDNLVVVETYKYRNSDMEFDRVNGVYLSNENVDYLPMGHRDNKNRPKYNIVKYGAEPIDAMRFFAYKSLASKLSNDKELVDRMRQNAVDASTFSTFPSIFTMGAGKMDKSIFIPATTVDLDKDAKVQPATGVANPQFSMNVAQMAEADMSKASVDPQLSGSSGGGDETARGRLLLQRNAITNLGVIGQMIARGMIVPIGELMADDIIRYQTVGETVNLSGGALGMKYRSLILNDQIVDGSKKSVIIRFTDRWAGRNLSDKEKKEMEVALFDEAGDNKQIHEVNPALWSRQNFMIIIDPGVLKRKNEELTANVKLGIYDRALNNPLIANDPEKLADVTRDFLFEPTVPGESSKYIPKDTKKALQGVIPEVGGPPGGGKVEKDVLDIAEVT